ncbi:hypothetical protein CR513_21916, partial [Mucuna pruriens]
MERFSTLRNSKLLPRGDGTQDLILRTNSFREREFDEILQTLGEKPQARMNNMETKALQGPMTRGRMRRLQEEVLKEMSLLKSEREPTKSPTLYFLWDFQTQKIASKTLKNMKPRTAIKVEIEHREDTKHKEVEALQGPLTKGRLKRFKEES